jgi:uncharacterized low-complexity protein
VEPAEGSRQEAGKDTAQSQDESRQQLQRADEVADVHAHDGHIGHGKCRADGGDHRST